jgi:hypothetical protein
MKPRLSYANVVATLASSLRSEAAPTQSRRTV